MSHELPAWADELRPHQVDAIAEILDHYQHGVKMVVLDAPTGSGKTLIADVVRQELGVPKTLYVCSGKALQDQFARDYPESRIIKGRTNYTPNKVPRIGKMALTCDDCNGPACTYCDPQASCPYQVARTEASIAETAVLNTSYYLAELNGPGRFRRRSFTIFDECDTLEENLLNWSQLGISSARCKTLGATMPPKGAHWKTLVAWVRDHLLTAVALHIRGYNLKDPAQAKEAEGWKRWERDLERFVDSRGGGEDWTKEMIGQKHQSLMLKPTMVSGFGERGIWRHAGTEDKWLLMSATVLSAAVMLKELGWTEDYQVVRVPMTFPVENRPIYNLPLAPVIYAATEQELQRLAGGVRGVVNRHRRESVLVHTVNYALTGRIVAALEGTGRNVHFYTNAREREAAVDAYRHDPGSVMVAPSLDRGVDLPGDMCRVQVIAKVPWPNSKDRRVSARLDADGGQAWYDVQTIRTLVQMTGRAVRSADDTAVTYILDSKFTDLHSKHHHMFPKWWNDAVSTPFQPLELLNANT
jgi:Rad3-related DNA helicase